MGKTVQVAADRVHDDTKTVVPAELARGIYIENPPGAQALKLMHLLGSGLIVDHNQNKTMAARMTAEKNVSGQRSYRVATRRQSFRRPNMISIRLRRLKRRLSNLTAFLRDFRPGMQTFIPLSFNASLNQSAS